MKKIIIGLVVVLIALCVGIAISDSDNDVKDSDNQVVQENTIKEPIGEVEDITPSPSSSKDAQEAKEFLQPIVEKAFGDAGIAGTGQLVVEDNAIILFIQCDEYEMAEIISNPQQYEQFKQIMKDNSIVIQQRLTQEGYDVVYGIAICKDENQTWLLISNGQVLYDVNDDLDLDSVDI